MTTVARSTVLALVLLLAAFGAAPPAAAQTAGAGFDGHLLIVGGGPRPLSIMERFVELAGGEGVARIAVIPTASGTPERAGDGLVAELLELGAAEAFNLNLSREQATRGEGVAELEGVTGVWFVGGSQTRITAAFKDTPVEEAFHRILREGAVLGGTSAGAAIMSGMMINGGERRPGGDRPVDDSWITLERDNVETEAGFGFLPNAIVDQHFVRRRRNNRLLSLVLENPRLIGVGIDESTAVQVNPDGSWEIVGESVALVYDARGARITAPEADVLGAAGLQLHILPPGSFFDPSTGEARLAPPAP